MFIPMSIAVTIIVLGFIIFIHELGHFLLAKLAKVRVLQFSLGFPPKALSKKIGETEYILGLIPFGGYVKMSGEEDKGDGNPWDYSNKHPLAKIAIILAGPLFNLIFGIFLLIFVLAVWGGVETDLSRPVVGKVKKNTPAHKVGILPGDSIIAVNGEPISSWEELTIKLRAFPGRRVTIDLIREKEKHTLSVRLSSRLYEGKRVGILGVYPKIYSKKVPYSPIGAIVEAFRKTAGFLQELFRFFGRLFSGEVSIKEVGGPIFIGQLAGQSARLGISYLLFFVAFLSINLAFINLFPIPMLDGGQIIFCTVEWIYRRPISAKTKLVFQKIGLVILLSLMLLIMSNDILRILGL